MDKGIAREEKQVLAAYLANNRLKRSERRDAIVDAFLRTERHLSVDELYRIVKRTHPEIGRTTVYRTLKLLKAAGLASELAIEGESRWEREWKREHHDHFICRSCGGIFEFSSAQIERLQEQVATGIGFVIEGHRHQIFGQCRKCVARERPRRAGA
ncbi:MAG: Fur family transcriptional regulator [Vicinamibacteria bacterium]